MDARKGDRLEYSSEEHVESGCHLQNKRHLTVREAVAGITVR